MEAFKWETREEDEKIDGPIPYKFNINVLNSEYILITDT